MNYNNNDELSGSESLEIDNFYLKFKGEESFKILRRIRWITLVRTQNNFSWSRTKKNFERNFIIQQLVLLILTFNFDSRMK